MTVGIQIGYTKARLAELALFAEATATICSMWSWSTPNSSRVAHSFPLSMSLLAQSGIQQMREPDTCFLQLLPHDRGVDFLGDDTVMRKDDHQLISDYFANT